MLVGRGPELTTLGNVVTRACLGLEPGALLVGDPGVGKTTLLDVAMDGWHGSRPPLHVVSAPVTVRPTFGALRTVLAPVADHIDHREANERTLARALGITGASRAEPTTAGAGLDSADAVEPDAAAAVASALVQLFGRLTDEGPLMVVVDDAQWIDLPSLAALGFAIRRLAGQPLVVLAAARTVGEPPLLPDLVRIPIRPLDPVDAAALVTTIRPDLAPGEAAELAARTGGNPLEVRRSAAGATADRLLPLRQGIADQLRALPAGTRAALVVAALHDDDRVAELAPAWAHLGMTAADLQPAAERGIVELAGDRASFVHPLMRDAVLDEASPRQLRAAHEALASAVVGTTRIWHRAIAADSVSSDLAELVAREAAHARAQGDLEAAARLYQRAADLSAPASAGERLLEAGLCWLGLGSPAAVGILQRLAAQDANPVLAGRAQLALARLAAWSGDRPATDALARDADARGLAPAPAMHALAASGAWIGFDEQAFAEHVDRLGDGSSPGLDPRHAGVLTAIRDLVRGELASSTLPDRLAPHVAAFGSDPEPILATPITMTLRGMGQTAWATELVEAAFDRAVSESNRPGMAWLYAMRCWQGPATGDLPGAISAGHLGLQLASDGGPLCEGATRAGLANALALRGEILDARQLAREAQGIARQLDDQVSVVQATIALARAASFSGDDLAAAESMAELADRPGAATWPCAVSTDLHLELVPVAVRAGLPGTQLIRLRRLLDGHAAVELPEPRFAAALADLCLCPDEELDARIADLETASAGLQHAYARLLGLVWTGERLRRARRPREARPPLAEAVRLAGALTATPLAERAARELRAAGGAIQDPGRSPLPSLTAQEQAVATLAGRGASTREIASTLFLSVKTVEFHLTHVYRKLGIRGRTELAVLLSGRPG